MASTKHPESAVICRSYFLQHFCVPAVFLFLIFLQASVFALNPGQPLPDAQSTKPAETPRQREKATQPLSLYQSRVMELIDYSLGFYMEELVMWNRPQVTFRHPAHQQFEHLNQIVVQALELYAHPAKDSFWGFSGRVEKKLLQLHQLEGYTVDFSNSATSSANSISQSELRNRVSELKTAATDEVAAFIEEHPDPIDSEGRLLTTEPPHATTEEDRMLQQLERASRMDVALLIDSLFELEEVPHGLINKINSRIQELEHPDETNTFRKHQPLDPIPHQITPEAEEDIAELDLNLPKKKKRTSTASPPVDFNSKVVQLLEENNRLMAKYNDRFEFMQQQINELRDEQRSESKQSEERLQKQIDDLYAKIDQGSSPMNEDVRTTAIIFERNSADIGLYYQTLLNEIAAGLIKHSNSKVMITGFADATGNREYNIMLSRKRAEKVRDYLSQKGISSSRLIVNFLGDNKSSNANPLDRKVEVEWLK